MYFLAKLLAVITRKPRTLVRVGVDFHWATHSWTHNVFRAYELLFGRRYGIKAEMTSWTDEEGQVHHACHSIESVFALTETYVREYLASWKVVPFRITFPAFAPVGMVRSPYLFAIAFDTVTQDYGSGGTGSPKTLTFAHTSTGSNLIAWTGVVSPNIAADPGIASVTYAGSGQTVTSTSPAYDNHANGQRVRLYWIVGQSTGAQNVVITANAGTTNYIGGVTASYSGAAQTGVPNATAKTENTAATTSCVVTCTTTVDNCWAVAIFRSEIGGSTFHAGTTSRYNNTDGGLGDSGGAITPAGSTSLQYDFGSAVNAGIIAAFAPPSAAVAPSITSDIIFFN